MFSFIIFLRAIAVILITNSHFDGVYPINISFGGAPGVSLFFMITGFLLAKLNKETDFNNWYWKKVFRIYIPLTIINIITVLIGYRAFDNIYEYIKLFIFPIFINLWYAPTIVVLYIAYFVVIKWFNKYINYLIYALISVYFIIYFTCFDLSTFFVEPKIYFRWIYGFICMLLGYKLYRKFKENSFLSISSKRVHYIEIICSFGFLAAFLVTKLLINHSSLIMKVQFLTQLFSVLFAYFTFRSLIYYENKLKVNSKKIWFKLVNLVSENSLEIYFIQFPIIALFKDIIFPINFLMIVVLTIICALIINKISNYLLKILVANRVRKEEVNV